MRSSTLLKRLFWIALFLYGTVDQYSAMPRTIYRIIAGWMMLAGLVTSLYFAWKEFRHRT